MIKSQLPQRAQDRNKNFSKRKEYMSKVKYIEPNCQQMLVSLAASTSVKAAEDLPHVWERDGDSSVNYLAGKDEKHN